MQMLSRMTIQCFRRSTSCRCRRCIRLTIRWLWDLSNR